MVAGPSQKMLLQADVAVPWPPRSSELGVGGSPPNINEGKTIKSPLMDAVVPEMGGVSAGNRHLSQHSKIFPTNQMNSLLLLKNSEPQKSEPFV